MTPCNYGGGEWERKRCYLDQVQVDLDRIYAAIAWVTLEEVHYLVDLVSQHTFVFGYLAQLPQVLSERLLDRVC